MGGIQKQIAPDALVSMDYYEKEYPLRVDLVYADARHPENIFETALYRKGAQLWLHGDFAAIVLRAAEILFEKHRGILVLKDGLRPVEAQQAMQETEIVRRNPHWCADGPQRLLSTPGAGGHPRGMAVDAAVEDESGRAWDMGTPFDFLTPDPAENPAGRDYMKFSEAILQNRARQQDAFEEAARQAGRAIVPLPAEWWDYRFPAAYFTAFAPVFDNDLPPDMKVVNGGF